MDLNFGVISIETQCV